jgi:hypothetical protein
MTKYIFINTVMQSYYFTFRKGLSRNMHQNTMLSVRVMVFNARFDATGDRTDTHHNRGIAANHYTTESVIFESDV